MYYSTIIISVVLSAISMPMIIGFARRRELYDATGGRKIHSGRVPRLGGMGMFWAFFATLGIFAILDNGRTLFGFGWRMYRLLPLALGAAGMHFLGLADDIKNLPARRKFFIQSLVALFVVLTGFRFRSLSYGLGAFDGAMKWVSFVISWGWIVGMTNAINLIDGMDGLAGGISAMASIAFSGFYLLEGDLPAAFICFTLAGVILGFLYFNFPAPKAKLFMGDSGSLFLGFSLSVMPFFGQTGGSPEAVGGAYSVGLLPSMAILAIPMIDTLCAIVRRKLAGQRIGQADRKHIHHLLMDYGYVPQRILKIVYCLTAVQVSIFLAARMMPPFLSFTLNFAALALVGAFFLYVKGLSPKET